MDFEYTSDQQLLRDSVTRLLADKYDFESRKRYLAGGGYSREIWHQFADLGLLGLPFGESEGGLGAGAVELLIVMEAFGRHLVLEPYLATIVLGGGCLRYGASTQLRQEILPKLIAGTHLAAFAHTERQARFDLADVTTTARRSGAGWQLNGAKKYVLHGASADYLIICARVSGEQRDRHGLGLFLVEAGSPGLGRRAYFTQDGTSAADITLSDVRVADGCLIGEPDNALPIVEKVVADGMAAACAEAVGAMERAFEMTIEYLKTRKQFGTTIGSFQALQHRAVDMLVALEQARSMALYAAMMSSESDVEARNQALSAAKVQICRSARFIGEQAVQLHGGIGVTEECQVGHYYRRLTMLELLFGDAAHHLSLLTATGNESTSATPPST
ncbi:MAG: acyl-CoA dehydrogenase family protein [Steroidobacteraceae bacterium]